MMDKTKVENNKNIDKLLAFLYAVVSFSTFFLVFILWVFIIPTNIKNIENGILLDCKETIGNYAKANSYYEKIPSSILDSFERSDWKITITEQESDNLYGLDQNKGAYAICSYLDHSIWLEQGYSGTSAIVHEMGHYADYVSGRCSLSEEWVLIWEEEGAMISEYGSTSSKEGFAEAFDKTILKGDSFAKKCPKSYAYMMKFFSDFDTLVANKNS